MKKADVLLLNLPTTSWYKEKFAKSNSMPPLGLLYIATVLNENGYKVKLIDFAVESYSKSYFIKTLEECSPALVGLSTYNESWKAQKVICKIIKEVLPNSKIFAGGAFATFCYSDVLNDTSTDFVIRGEGEYRTLELANAVLGNSSDSLNNISGIVYKKASGELYINPTFSRIKDLDKLPFPDRSLLDLQKYLIPFTVSTARGCPGECIFCSSKAFWGRKVYMRSAKSVFDEVMDIYRKYENTIFYITDDTFTSSPKRIFEFCRMIKESGIKFVWGCESRADVLTDKLMQTISEAGCKKIQIGLESADNEILKKLKKIVTIEQIEEGIRLAFKYGMHISASFIIGHAFDTPETIQKTLDFAQYIQKKYGAYVMGSVNTPFPGTEQYEKAEELGIHIFTKEWDNYKLNSPIISTRMITREKLRQYHNQVVNIMNNNNIHYDSEVLEGLEE